MKKTAAILLAVVLMLAALPAVSAAQNFTLVSINGGSTIPDAAQGSTFAAGTLTFKNDEAAKIELVSYKIADYFNDTKHPFEIVNLDDDIPTSASAEAGSNFVLDLTALKIRSNATLGYCEVPITLTYKLFTDPANPTTDTCNITLRMNIVQKTDTPANALVPKILISGFSTNPSTVIAGNTFTLTVTFTNKGGSPVSSLKASMSSDGTFSPISGSSTLFIDNLNPGESKNASIKLEAKADASPGSYTLSFALNYDAPGANNNEPVTDTEVLSLPVIQVPKITVDKLTVAPETVYANGEINITTKVNNTGKSILYNLTADFTDKNGIFADGSVFVGNVSPGAAGTIDVYLAAMGLGEADIKMTITYENESGKKYTYEDSYSTFVTEKEIVPVDPVIPDEPVKSGPAWWVYLVLFLIVGGIAALILLKKLKAKKARESERNEALELEAELLKDDDQPDDGKF